MGFGWALTGAIPALVAMWILDRLDAKRPEPRGLLRKVAIAGGAAGVPVVVAYLLLMELTPETEYAARAYRAFVLAGGLEEAAKFLVVYWLVWRWPGFQRRTAAIVYAARAGLGFALVENVMYLARAPDFEEFVLVYVGRAVLALPAHAMFSGIVGYFAARKHFDGVGIGLAGGYVIAVALHGLYDVAIMWYPLLHERAGAIAALALLVPLLVVAGCAVTLRRLVHRANALDARTGELS